GEREEGRPVGIREMMSIGEGGVDAQKSAITALVRQTLERPALLVEVRIGGARRPGPGTDAVGRDADAPRIPAVPETRNADRSAVGGAHIRLEQNLRIGTGVFLRRVEGDLEHLVAADTGFQNVLVLLLLVPVGGIVRAENDLRAELRGERLPIP